MQQLINFGKLVTMSRGRRQALRVAFKHIVDTSNDPYKVEEAKKALVGLDRLTLTRARAIQISLGNIV